jgi:hypothetical protein
MAKTAVTKHSLKYKTRSFVLIQVSAQACSVSMNYKMDFRNVLLVERLNSDRIFQLEFLMEIIRLNSQLSISAKIHKVRMYSKDLYSLTVRSFLMITLSIGN